MATKKATTRKTSTRRASRVGPVVPARPKSDPRPEVREVLANIHATLPTLRARLEEVRWDGEDGFYRFYRGSPKVFELQRATLGIASSLRGLAPDRPLNASFAALVKEGTGREFTPGDNHRWVEATRPIVEAFLHARFFLEMAVRFGTQLKSPPAVLPPGWAALLCLYDLR